MDKSAKTRKIDSFRLVSRQYSDTSVMMHEAIARKAELTGTDHKYLGLLMQKGPMTAGELAALTGLTTGAVTGLIDRFEKKNLVRRTFAREDRRKVIIVPDTRNVQKLLDPLFAGLQEQTSDLIASFTETEIGIIERYFRSAIGVMNNVMNTLNNKSNGQH